VTNQDGKHKYFALMETLKKDILSGKIKAGDKLPSENELSKQYNISRHTVRKAIGILTHEGYVVAEHGRGTFCSERMRHTKQSKNIGVITTYILDYIFPRLIQGMDKVLTANGYSIMLKNTGNSRGKEIKCLEDFLSKDIDGLIIEPSKSQLFCKHTRLYEMLDEYEIPYVFIQGIYSQMKNKPHILMDDLKGAHLLTKYLIELGHKSIVGIFKADDFQGIQRHKGYVKALREAGISYDPEMVIWFHTEDRRIKPGSEVETMIQSKRKMEAIVCYNDQIALEIVRIINSKGLKVPEDISVTGYDNSFISENGEIKLTTIAHPQEKLGEMAAELLLELINRANPKVVKVETLIEPQLIIRDSCKERRNNS